MIISYIRHLLKANTLHGTHSPFVYKFLENVVYKKSTHTLFEKIEHLRNELLHQHNTIEISDFGAGSKIYKTNKRSISNIAQTSVKSKKYCELLYRISEWHKPDNVLELGTSLGISTAYLSLASKNVITIEGCKNIAEIANQNFKKLQIKNIQLINNQFDYCLNIELEKIKNQKNLYYIDGNHKKNATIKYFETILQYATEIDILILDDIHWSIEMEEAWKYICQHKNITITIDLFWLGIVFLHKTQAKENFIIRY